VAAAQQNDGPGRNQKKENSGDEARERGMRNNGGLQGSQGEQPVS